MLVLYLLWRLYSALADSLLRLLHRLPMHLLLPPLLLHLRLLLHLHLRKQMTKKMIAAEP